MIPPCVRIDVVTGKVDVRGAELPETSDDELLSLAEESADTEEPSDDETVLEVKE